MSKDTKIEWAHHTFNPWVGCTKVSPACDHCYAESWAKRSAMVQWGPHADRRRTSQNNWHQPLKWNAEAERLGVRYRVFCASLADVFDNAVPQEWRDDLFTLVEQTPHLDWLLLTKRIGNVGNMLPVPFDFDCHYPNVWIGATICNQEEADRDIPKLLAVPAAKRFLSMEPLLGPVSIAEYLTESAPNCKTGFIQSERYEKGYCETCAGHADDPIHNPYLRDRIDWVIAGGESGHAARPMSPDWARKLRDECRAAHVPFLFKQWGEWLPMLGQAQSIPVRKTSSTNDGWIMGWAGKKHAGRALDGDIWDEVPT